MALLVRMVGVLLMGAAVTACAPSTKVNNYSGDAGDSQGDLGQCPIKRVGKRKPGDAVGPFTKSNSKVILASDLYIKTKTVKDNLKNDLKLSVTINHKCLRAGKGSDFSNQFTLKTSPEVMSHSYKVSKGESLSRFRSIVNSDSCVMFVGDELVSKISALKAKDPRISKQKHLSALGIFKVTDYLYSKKKGITKSVVVAIIDSGVETRHKDLKANLWVNKKEIPGNRIDDDGNGYIDDVHGYNFASKVGSPRPQGVGQDHGTHVAGIAGAVFDNGVGGSGVLGKNVQIMGLNIFGRFQGAVTPDIDNAIRYAADNGADVINMSFGACGYTASTGQAISYAIQKGSVVLASSGNDNLKLSANSKDGANCNKSGAVFDTPGSFAPKNKGMITVGSVDSVNTGSLNSYSNYGTSVVGIAAPGADDESAGLGILSTVLRNSYARYMGTSMAAPVTAGAAAIVIGILKSRGIDYTPADVADLMLEASPSKSSLQSSIKNGKTLSVEGIVNKLNEMYPLPEDPKEEPGVDVPPQC